eukprot:g19427.t1
MLLSVLAGSEAALLTAAAALVGLAGFRLLIGAAMGLLVAQIFVSWAAGWFGPSGVSFWYLAFLTIGVAATGFDKTTFPVIGYAIGGFLFSSSVVFFLAEFLSLGQLPTSWIDSADAFLNGDHPEQILGEAFIVLRVAGFFLWLVQTRVSFSVRHGRGVAPPRQRCSSGRGAPCGRGRSTPRSWDSLLDRSGSHCLKEMKRSCRPDTDCVPASVPSASQADFDEVHEAAGPGEMFGKARAPIWNARMPSVGYCSTAATTPMASATASAMPSTPTQENISAELTPRGQEGRADLTNAEGQHDLLSGGHFRLGNACLQVARWLPSQADFDEVHEAEGPGEMSGKARTPMWNAQMPSEGRGGDLVSAPEQHDLLPGGMGRFRLGTSCLQVARWPLASPIQRMDEAEAEAHFKADGLGALREPGKELRNRSPCDGSESKIQCLWSNDRKFQIRL